jgi:NCAIR mutase (PurE)-related protein
LSRTGQQEVVFGEGKRTGDIVAILCKLRDSGQAGLVTRLDGDKAQAIQAELPDAIWHDRARILELPTGDARPTPAVQGVISVVCAGTSDLPVAEEAAVVAEFFGHPIERYWDVGVAGIHRILNHREALSSSACIIVIAGMEGALASVVGGMVPCPVVAVPTSVGYGASFGGLAALLGMLNSCAAGVSVVNIDNGFGAAMMAIRINRRMDG